MSLSSDITICVCTFRRPQIIDTLASLMAMNAPPDCRVSVLVVDNDHSPSAQKLVEGFAASSRFDIRYLHCPAGNISLARNGALDNCESRYLAFIDDDEIASEDWLRNLARVAQNDALDVVLGPVQAVYRPQAPEWMRVLSIHSTKQVWVDGHIKSGYSSNVQVDLECPAVSGLRFDPELGQTGGEDTKYFTQVFRRGGKIGYAADALVQEDVPESRACFSWLLKRRFRMGQTHGRLMLEGRRGFLPTAGALAKVFGKIVFCFATAGLNILNPARRNNAILRGLMHMGVVFGIFGIRELRLYGPDMTDNRTT